MSQQINLFDPIFLTQRKYFSLLAMLQALGLIVVGSLLFYGYAFYQVQYLNDQSLDDTKRYKDDLARYERYKAEFSPQQAALSLQGEVQQLERQVAEQAELVETLKSGAVGNTSGYSGYMSAFARQLVQGLWLTGFDMSGDGAQISLSGGVLSPELLPAYIQRLGREPVMQGKSFATLQMKQPKTDAAADSRPLSGYVEFTLHSTPENSVSESGVKQ